MKKSVGIITMHRVINYGSALQAYALQKSIESLGYSAKLIDYFYGKKKCSKKPIKKIVNWFVQLMLGFPENKKIKKFREFYKNNYNLTEQFYNSKDFLQKNPPLFDIYITGSDQVWNPRFITDDTNFMLSFVSDDKPRLSYAASFATNEIPDELNKLYKQYLQKYDQICVREQSNTKIIKELTGKDSTVVCDPTLLLTAKEWETTLKLGTQKKDNPYILVYILSYMYNPYPFINNIINYVKSILGYQVVFLGGKMSNSFRLNVKCIRNGGPEDFVDLIRNASFVITDSFHGTAFASIFGIPMLGIIKSKDTKDGRLITLLDKIGGSHSLIEYTESINYNKEQLLRLKCNSSLLNEYREFSINTLKDMLKKYDLL